MMSENWGKEPFDLRLTVLRLIRSLPAILVVIVAGTLLFGGGYYVKNVLLQPEGTYSASAMFYVEYSNPDWAAQGTYINYMTWDNWMDTREFTEYVQSHLQGETLSNERLAEILSASVPADLRVPVVTATSKDPAEAQHVLAAAVQAMVEDFPVNIRDVDSIRETDTKPAVKDVADVRPVRAFVLAAVLSTLFAVALFLLKEIGDEKIWLPSTLTRKFGLKQPGVEGSAMYGQNLMHFFEGKKQVAVCPTQEDMDPAQIAGALNAVMKAAGGQEIFQPFPCLELSPEITEKLRQAEGIILAVPAGDKDCKHLEYVLDTMKQQDLEITAAVLWQQDLWLLKNYYRFTTRKDHL